MAQRVEKELNEGTLFICQFHSAGAAPPVFCFAARDVPKSAVDIDPACIHAYSTYIYAGMMVEFRCTAFAQGRDDSRHES
jgi:hypothetical protein